MKKNNILHFNIGVMWKKRIGKNFFSQVLSDVLVDRWMEPLSEISIASSIKYQSIFPQWFENDNFNYSYLLNDIKKLYDHGTLEDLLVSNGRKNWEWIHEYFTINWFHEDDIRWWDKEQILDMIEVFKVEEPFLSTRRHLQEFWDYLKEKNSNPFILSETLIWELRKKEYQHDICTDTRFITELIDFILNDFYIIQLRNNEMNTTKEYDINQHTSELELGHYQHNLWHVFDLYTEHWEFIQWVHRMDYNNLYQYIEYELPKILSFQWYSKETKSVIREIKNKIIEDYRNGVWFLRKQEEFSLKQKYILSIKNSWVQPSYTDIEEYEYLYAEYLMLRDKILFSIQDTIKEYYIY